MKQTPLLLAALCLILALSGVVQAASTVHVTTTQTYQTMEGFGAAIAWYENWLTAHPDKSDIWVPDLALPLAEMLISAAKTATT